ncbi:MAG: MBL fold metallo-hydrolase [Negativicutes bacterium]|nr:MBL fold metallo-hydrolase [Negativicutes bacterium]
MIKVLQTPVGELATNCYVVACADTGEAMVVDPGAEAERIELLVRRGSLKVVGIALTHGHADHIGAVPILRDRWAVPVYIHAGDGEMLTSPQKNLSAFLERPVSSRPADVLLTDGDELSFGRVKLTVLHTPGHTPGGACFYGEGVVLSGDTLFAGSVGRTDFPGGSLSQLVGSIREKLFVLPDGVVVYPGHYEQTTIGREKRFNEFVGQL